MEFYGSLNRNLRIKSDILFVLVHQSRILTIQEKFQYFYFHSRLYFPIDTNIVYS
jgi:hypothetical protein